MAFVKDLVGTLYHAGLQVDRKLKIAREIPGYPVISVGNIAVGGRAKTPLVIYLCLGLKERGFDPIVLTRGYGRKATHNVFLGVESEFRFDADECGDEALEIWAKTRAPVLVGANRYQNALRFLAKKREGLRPVFVIDDGFQHWSIKRDIDLVVVHPEDYHSRLLPFGRLREPVAALQRADIVLELGRDIEKIPTLEVLKTASSTEPTLALTTRAPDKSFEAVMSQYFQNIRVAALADHAPRDRLLYELAHSSERQVVVGGKEAVKLITDLPALEQLFRTGHAEITVKNRRFDLYYIGLTLKLRDETDIWRRIEKRTQRL